MAATALRIGRPVKALTEQVYHWTSEYPVGYTAAFTREAPEVSPESTRVSPQIVVTTSQPVNWVQPTVAAMRAMLSLGDDWDSYGGKQTDREIVTRALVLLIRVMAFHSVAPSVVPLGDGGLQLEWHRRQQDLEITFPVDEVPSYFYQNRQTGQEAEGLATDVTNLGNLVESIV